MTGPAPRHRVICPDCDWVHTDAPGRPDAQTAARQHEHGGCGGLIFTTAPQPTQGDLFTPEELTA